MHATNCPFCGVVTDAPHNTQQGCIDALNGEITRMRQLLDQVRPTAADPIQGPAPERDTTPQP